MVDREHSEVFPRLFIITVQRQGLRQRNKTVRTFIQSSEYDAEITLSPEVQRIDQDSFLIVVFGLLQLSKVLINIGQVVVTPQVVRVQHQRILVIRKGFFNTTSAFLQRTKIGVGTLIKRVQFNCLKIGPFRLVEFFSMGIESQAEVVEQCRVFWVPLSRLLVVVDCFRQIPSFNQREAKLGMLSCR